MEVEYDARTVCEILPKRVAGKTAGTAHIWRFAAFLCTAASVWQCDKRGDMDFTEYNIRARHNCMFLIYQEVGSCNVRYCDRITLCYKQNIKRKLN